MGAYGKASLTSSRRLAAFPVETVLAASLHRVRVAKTWTSAYREMSAAPNTVNQALKVSRI